MEGPFERLNNAGLTKVKAEDLAIFFKFQNDREGKLELLHKICERFLAMVEEASFPPFIKKDILSFSCQCKAVHEVPSFGFVLLHRDKAIIRDVPLLLNILSCKCGYGWGGSTKVFYY